MARAERKTECRSLHHQRITKQIHMFLQVKSTYQHSAYYAMALKQYTHMLDVTSTNFSTNTIETSKSHEREKFEANLSHLRGTRQLITTIDNSHNSTINTHLKCHRDIHRIHFRAGFRKTRGIPPCSPRLTIYLCHLHD